MSFRIPSFFTTPSFAGSIAILVIAAIGDVLTTGEVGLFAVLFGSIYLGALVVSPVAAGIPRALRRWPYATALLDAASAATPSRVTLSVVLVLFLLAETYARAAGSVPAQPFLLPLAALVPLLAVLSAIRDRAASTKRQNP